MYSVLMYGTVSVFPYCCALIRHTVHSELARAGEHDRGLFSFQRSQEVSVLPYAVQVRCPL